MSRAAAGAVSAPPELTLAHLESLPTLPAIAIKLVQAAADPKTDADDIAALIKGDQSLAAKVLSAANSALAGGRGVSTVEQAVVRLGFRAVRNLVLATKVFECFPPDRSRPAKRFDRTEFWRHALAVACAARRLALARPAPGVDAEEAYLAGLLHDLGKVALHAVFPKGYERVIAESERQRGDIADCERAVLGVDHFVAGRRLAERWRLPRYLQEVIWLHQMSVEALPTCIEMPALIGIVRLADTLAREQRIGFSGNHAFYESAATLTEQLGFSPEQLESVAATLVTDVAEQSALLGLDQPAPETLYLQSLTRANAELARLNSELLETNRRLSAAARYFQAITAFDQRLHTQADLSTVVAAMVEAASGALQRPRVACFGLHADRTALDTAWSSAEGQVHIATERVDAGIAAWLTADEPPPETPVLRAPAALRAALIPLWQRLGEGECWLLPIVHDQRLTGGVLLASERDERAELAAERDELRSFLASLGLAIGRANALGEIRRLSDDLVETNRRLQHIQSEALRARTLAMIAEMAAGAGHELNSPLFVISGRAELLRRSVADPEVRRALDVIHAKAHECSRIVSELMEFARPRAPQIAPLDLPALLAELQRHWLMQSGMPASRLQLVFPEPAAAPGPAAPEALRTVPADREQLQSVLNELLRNAVDSLEGRQGGITIAARIAAAEASFAGASLSRRPVWAEAGGWSTQPAAAATGRWVEITIRDGGAGMPPSVLRRVFEPFFSYRRAGRGRGLGLARAYRIIEAHGGRIWLESALDQGTTAHVLLPLDRPAANPPQTATPS